MSEIAVKGDLKYLLFIFLGVMVSILVLGYHKSPTAGKQLGTTQSMMRQPNAPKTINYMNTSTVSTGEYAHTSPY
jgi:hypothetical protein